MARIVRSSASLPSSTKATPSLSRLLLFASSNAHFLTTAGSRSASVMEYTSMNSTLVLRGKEALFVLRKLMAKRRREWCSCTRRRWVGVCEAEAFGVKEGGGMRRVVLRLDGGAIIGWW